jgi:hypothetical protein
MSIKKEFEFENGQEVVEKVTGFQGTITGTCYYLTGCNQYLVTAKAKDMTKEPVAMWYDEGRLTLVKDNLTEKDVATKSGSRGCDRVPNYGKRGC